ncbi:MAG: NAD-dependent epimerase/dehydratase family protein [Acidobacteriota bacterium]|jgi:dihydroflavonol-4-reductase|nr:NAD-dependent epimerase/dehydratase family protein [Acidobacteriota bacterium]
MSDYWDSLRIGVTGAGGFIGSRLVRALAANGARVRALVHQTPLAENVEILRGDVTDAGFMAKFCDDLDGIFHLATALGNRRIPQSEFMRINAHGTTVLLQQASRAGVKRVVHFGSAGIFGRTSGRELLTEQHQGHPVDAYEKSKAAGEQAAMSWESLPEVCVIRPGWVYGEGDRRTFKLIRRIHSGLFFIAGSGRILQTPVYIDDLVAAALAVYRQGIHGRDYNAAGNAVTVNELTKAIAVALGRNRRFAHIPVSLLLPAAWIMEPLFALAGREAPLNRARLAFFRRGKPLDSTRIRTELRVGFDTSLQQGLGKTVRGYREMGWLPPA